MQRPQRRLEMMAAVRQERGPTSNTHQRLDMPHVFVLTCLCPSHPRAGLLRTLLVDLLRIPHRRGILRSDLCQFVRRPRA